jgi:3-isopropylmalate/(R)-2-methylmalate dehydratase small subunit
MILYATTHRVGDAITTDDIIAPEWRASNDPAALAAHCLAGVAPAVAEHAREGDVLLAGRDFGAGADPDVAALALQAAGFAAIACSSADPNFVSAAEEFGLPVLVCPTAVAALAEGVVVRIDLERGRIDDRASGASYAAPPCKPELIAAARRAQLLARMRRVVEEEGFDG